MGPVNLLQNANMGSNWMGELSLVHAGFVSLVHAGFVSLVHAGSQVVSSRDHVVQKGEATKF